MQMRIQGKPVFCFSPSQKQIDLLKVMSQHHYDAVCQQASSVAGDGSVNGFLTIWEMTLQLYEGDPFEVEASNSTIQTCLKIMEDARLHRFNESDMKIINEIESVFYQALRVSNTLWSGWSYTMPDTKE